MIGYHASGTAAIVRALCGAPVRSDDVVIDLGAGLGKVVCLAEQLARTRGIELQADLAERARRVCRSPIETIDVRDADLSDGTVFFLYLPFTGRILDSVLEKLRAIDHPIVVCGLGIEIRADFLKPRPSDDFWLTIYDSAEPRPARSWTAEERAVAFEM